jgi:hypothetical protein
VGFIRSSHGDYLLHVFPVAKFTMIRNAFLLIVLCIPALANDNANKAQDTAGLGSSVVAELSSKQGDYVHHALRRVGDRTFEINCVISSEGNFEWATSALSDFSAYRLWVLNNINKRPGGGEYYVKVSDVGPVPGQRNKLAITFTISIGSFSYSSTRIFAMRHENKDRAFILHGESVPEPSSLVSRAWGTLTMMRAPKQENRLWIHVNGRAQHTSALLYNLLPDPPVKREAGQRVQIAIDNYLDWENRKFR